MTAASERRSPSGPPPAAALFTLLPKTFLPSVFRSFGFNDVPHNEGGRGKSQGRRERSTIQVINVLRQETGWLKRPDDDCVLMGLLSSLSVGGLNEKFTSYDSCVHLRRRIAPIKRERQKRAS